MTSGFRSRSDTCRIVLPGWNWISGPTWGAGAVVAKETNRHSAAISSKLAGYHAFGSRAQRSVLLQVGRGPGRVGVEREQPPGRAAHRHQKAQDFPIDHATTDHDRWTSFLPRKPGGSPQGPHSQRSAWR